MQKYCIDKQDKAFKNMMRRMSSSQKGDTFNNILNNCMNKWKETEYSYDWHMVEYCNKKQIDAYFQIHQ
jgi:hypothetical protein